MDGNGTKRKTKANKTENKIAKSEKRKNLSEKKSFPEDFFLPFFAIRKTRHQVNCERKRREKEKECLKTPKFSKNKERRQIK